MSDEYYKCERCGGEMRPMAGSRVGLQETWRCERCGFEARVHILPVEDPGSRKDAMVDLVVYWRRVPPTVGELVALRKTFQQFANVPPHELEKQVGSASRFVVGPCEEGPAELLRREAIQNGLDLRLEPQGQ